MPPTKLFDLSGRIAVMNGGIGRGIALYTVQGLWTQAREMLDVATVVLSNRKYAILELELINVGAGANSGRTALDLFDLENPALDWICLAGAMGVEASRAETLEKLADLPAVSNRLVIR